MVVVHCLDHCLFEDDLVYDNEGIVGSEDGCPVGCFCTSVGYLGSCGDSVEDLVVV